MAVGTIGPADPQAPLRAKIYAGLSAVVGLVSLAVTLGFVTSDQGAHLTQIAQGIVGLLGAGGLAVASSKTSKQVSNGSFDPAPESPVQNAFEQLGTIKRAVDDVVDDAQARVAQGVAAIQGATAMIPRGTFGVGTPIPDSVANLIRSVSESRETD